MNPDTSMSFRLPERDVRPEGVWFYWRRGVRLKIAAWGSRSFAGTVSALLRRESENLRRPILDSERAVIDTAEMEAVSRVVLLDWENMTHEHTGAALEFKPANVVEQLVMRHGLYEFIVEKAKTLPMD